jgi:ABC-type polysaccharide/polyol phosphate export permease
MNAPDVMIDRAGERDSVVRTLRALIRYRHLMRSLVANDLKHQYRGSARGLLWSMLNPLLMIAVYTIAFTYILKVPIQGFVFYLMLGLLAWTFFASSTVMSAGAIVDNGGLLKSVFFPRAIPPIASVLFNLAQYLLTTLVFLPVMLIFYRVAPAPPMLLFPVFVALQVLFTIGIALIVATATTFFRDVRHFLEIGLQVLFWLTPVIYQFDQISSPALRQAIRLTPMSPFVIAYQTIFFYGQWPPATVWGLALLYTAVALVTGTFLMLRHEDQFAELI